MKLYLAAVVLMLAFIAHTEAQEETIEQKMATFGQTMTEMTKTFADKAKTTFQEIETSDFAVSTKNWFNEQFEKIKAKVQEMSA